MVWRRAEPCDVLVVCTGNVARSPYVAARLAQELPDLVVRSAGTAALVGDPPTDGSLDQLRQRGIAIEGMPARQLRRRDLRGARLVLTAEAAHRVTAARLAPEVADRAFTVRELARVVAGSSAVGLDDVLAAGRAAVAAGDDRDHDDDLADPYGGTNDDYAAMAATVEAALAVLVPALGGQR